MAYVGGKLKPWFDNAPNERAMRNFVRISIREGREIAEKKTPVDTGDLASAWKVGEHVSRRITLVGVGWEGTWYNDVEYAVYVEHGTGLFGPEHRKYLIVPKTPGGTLHWVDKLTGEDVFAKFVMHPGSEGAHMLAKSAAVVEATFTRLARPALKNWVREVERQNPTARVT
jgi:hypothetical protein